jgi:predicted Fe-Mo cluster-binding NifX family protein
MTICIPTTSDAGASARLSPDLGRAHFFTMVDVESARAWTIPNPDRRYEPGDHGAPGTMGGGSSMR